jgi:Family of unknown function (DUF6152)
MRSKVLILLVLAAVALGWASATSAHHGFTHYDMKKTITLTGVITAFEWSNPHCLVYVDVMDNDNQVQHWTLEMASTFAMSRRGWSKDTIKRGDHAIVETHPAENGAPVGISASPSFALKFVVNGKEMPAR